MNRGGAMRWVALGLTALLAVAVVIVPAVLIRPFSAQTPVGLTVGYWLRRWGPLITLATLAASAFLVWRVWRSRSPVLHRVLAALFVVPSVGAAWLARQNYFEWMFAPIPDPRFVRPPQADFVDPEDMVLSVTIGSDAAAYPVRQLAYHHLVNDSVGGVPIVATY